MTGEKNAARLLRELRQRRGQSLRAVAEEVGVAASYLSRLERGERSVNDGVVERLADYYGVPHEVLALDEGRLPEDIVQILKSHPHEFERLRRRYGSHSPGEQSDK
jgi:transcriptional regulator with XRE-family HTH domain